MKKIIYSLEEIEFVAQQVKGEISDCDVVTFSGSLGAGKTTLIRALAKSLGIKDEVTSPTFAYVNLYEDESGKQYAHFDLYRLTSAEDFIAMGFDEYLVGRQLLVEWPEVLSSLLKGKRVCRITIDYEGFDKRVMHMTKELM